jgi:hypothetical protein
MEVNGQLHVPAALIPAKNLRYTLDRRLVGLRGGLNAVAKRKILSLCRESYPGLPTRIPVAIKEEGGCHFEPESLLS